MPRLTGPLKFCSFWPRTKWQWSPIPPTHPIWPSVTFSSSPSWSFGWGVEDSTPLKRFKRNRSGYLTQFQEGTSRDASQHGRKAGTAVFVRKGSTLKVMEELNIQGKQTSFYKYCPGTFGYALVVFKVCRLLAYSTRSQWWGCHLSLWAGWFSVGVSSLSLWRSPFSTRQWCWFWSTLGILFPQYPPYLVSLPLSATWGGARWETSNSTWGWGLGDQTSC